VLTVESTLNAIDALRQVHHFSAVSLLPHTEQTLGKQHGTLNGIYVPAALL
jgi:hypothetical protein